MNLNEIEQQTKRVQDEIRKHPFFVLSYFTASEPEAVRINEQLKQSWALSQQVFELCKQINQGTK